VQVFLIGAATYTIGGGGEHGGGGWSQWDGDTRTAGFTMSFEVDSTGRVSGRRCVAPMPMRGCGAGGI
jgi:hypothetical protein